MRVIAGSARSMPLKAPAGYDTRPTQDRIKETLFNMVQTLIPGCVFVDVFSGSGGIGIEALSRGARKAYFIENDAKAAACIQDNLAFTKLNDKAVLLKQDFVQALYNVFEKTVDIIYMDPPYQKELEKTALMLLGNASYVTQDTIVIVEADLKTDMEYASDYGFEITKVKRYKTNKHIFLRRKPTAVVE